MLIKLNHSKPFKIKVILFNLLFIFFLTFLVFQFYVENLSEVTKKNFQYISQNITAKIYDKMKNGDRKENLKNYIEKEMSFPEDIKTFIYRTNIVEEKFGKSNQPVFNKNVIDSYENKKEIFVNNGSNFNYYYPLRFEQKCSSCHTNAKENDILGIIHIEQKNLYSSFLMFTFMKYIFLILLLSFSLYLFYKKQYVQEIKNLFISMLKKINKKINNIENYNDLDDLKIDEDDCNIKEFNKFILNYQNKIKELTFDKKLMNFQLDLLKNFLITTNVIDNWVEYLKKVFVDLNQNITLNILYSVLKIEKNKYEVLVIWKFIPSEKLKQDIENEIAEKFHINEHVFLIYTHEFINDSYFEDEGTIFIKNTEYVHEYNTKTLVLKEPCIGGIIGVGFDSNDKIIKENEKMKNIMLENVLTVLMNLIGSIKTISSYVSDINNLATRDVLTGLLNRRVFYEMANNKIRQSERKEGIFCLLFVDVDNFKIINDNYGHNRGDDFLKNLAKILNNNTRQEDIVARYGGDEFVIILDEIGIEESKVVVNRIQSDLKFFKEQQEEFVPKEISLSIGIVEYPTHGNTIEELLSISDEMMYKGKEDGKNQIITCDKILLDQLIEKNKLKKEIVFEAVKESLLVPYFQKIYNPNNEKDVVYELLMRIEVKNKILRAEEFIDIAESTGLINELDLQLFNKALLYLKSINYKNKLFVNISPKSLMAHNYIDNITRIVKDNDFKPSNIVFEITERDTVKNIMYLERLIKELISKGFQFAVDDFGSGFSSFLYIKKFDISYLKIDGSFINNIDKNKTDLTFVKSIIYLAKELNIKTVAEFVETEEIYKILVALGVDYVQGYYIHKPDGELQNNDIKGKKRNVIKS